LLREYWAEKALTEYSFGRLSYKQIGDKYNKHIITVQRNFDKIRLNYFLSTPKDKEINVSFDGVYFGRDLCYIVFRAEGKTIYFKRCAETVENISRCLKELEARGYGFKSFTIDGRKGMAEHLNVQYPNVPVQYCHFHQKKTIRHYLQREPKTQCREELKDFTAKLGAMSKCEFVEGIDALSGKYENFLAERDSKRKYKHGGIRSAIRSMRTNADILFTYKERAEPGISNTTNTCEGYFSQLKRKVRAHPGLTRIRLIKLIERLFYGIND
jgi:hypothetical protein